MSLSQARYVAIPGDACFQCHGVGPCVDSPPQAVLPLVIHYYGNKDAIHELDRITAMPYLSQSLFGHGELPPYWCLHEWKAAADFAVACQHRAGISWPPQPWTDTGPLPPDEPAASPHAVLSLASNIQDGLPPVPHEEQPARLPSGGQAASEHPTRPPAGGQVEGDQPTRLPSGGQVVQVYCTGLNGGHPHDIPQGIESTSPSTYAVPMAPVCLKCSQISTVAKTA